MSQLDTLLDRLAKRFDLTYCPCCGAKTDAPISHCGCKICLAHPNCCMACGQAISNAFVLDDHNIRADMGEIDCPVRYEITSEGVHESKAPA